MFPRNTPVFVHHQPVLTHAGRWSGITFRTPHHTTVGCARVHAARFKGAQTGAGRTGRRARPLRVIDGAVGRSWSSRGTLARAFGVMVHLTGRSCRRRWWTLSRNTLGVVARTGWCFRSWWALAGTLGRQYAAALVQYVALVADTSRWACTGCDAEDLATVVVTRRLAAGRAGAVPGVWTAHLYRLLYRTLLPLDTATLVPHEPTVAGTHERTRRRLRRTEHSSTVGRAGLLTADR